jgi:hypothetical protein
VRRWIIGFSILIGIFLLLGLWVIDSLLYDEYEVLESNWGIQLPQAEKITDLIITENSFHGDGEWFEIFQYSKPVDLTKRGFTELTFEQTNEANDHIASFTQKTLDIRNNEKSVVEVFQNNDIEAEVGDYYYYEERNNGYDTISLLYKRYTNELFIYEWHQ